MLPGRAEAMNRRVMMILTMLCICTLGSARTYERVRRSSFWNDGSNAAGIRQDTASVACAEIYGGYEAGGLHDYGAAPRSWNAGARTMAFKHLERLSLAGSFAFEQKQGYDMFGSMFIEPGFYPVDVLEFTPGRKTLQKYTFDGKVSYDLNDNWRIGAGMDFLSANLAKSKDLRHTNYRLDFSVAPSVIWHSGDWALGISAMVGKNSESIDAEVIGTAQSTYYAFFDKGLMYGIHEGWEGSSIHLKEAGVKGLPVSEITGGGALQISWRKLYADLEYTYGDGRIGEKEFLWYRFPGHGLRARLGYRFTAGEYTHGFRLDASMRRQKNLEAVMEKVTVGGVTNVTIYAFNNIFERRTFEVNPEYELVSDLWELKWNARAGIFSGVSSQKYPFVYMQNIIDASTSAEALVHVWKFDIGAGVGFAKGFFDEQNRMMLPASESKRPDRMEDYAAYRIEYMEAARIRAVLKLRFNFWKGLYVQADGGYEHAFDVELLPGSSRICTSLRIGYDF